MIQLSMPQPTPKNTLDGMKAFKHTLNIGTISLIPFVGCETN